MRYRPVLGCVLALVFVLLLSQPSGAAEKLRVGKAVQQAFTFTLLDLGVERGFFARQGLDIEMAAFAGGSRLQQGMAADSIDIGLDTGPDLAFVAKGAPVKGVGAMAGPPLDTGILVRGDGPIRSVADLKDKKIGTSVVTALMAWLMKELSRQQGWGPDGIGLVATGSPTASLALVKTGQLDGMASDLGLAMQAEARGEGRVLLRFGDFIKEFHNYVIFATDTLIAKNPQAVHGFLKGWYDTIAFARADKGATVETVSRVLGFDRAIVDRLYDLQMPMYSADGRFDAAALAALRRSYVDVGTLDHEPDMAKLYTEEFLPAR